MESLIATSPQRLVCGEEHVISLAGPNHMSTGHYCSGELHPRKPIPGNGWCVAESPQDSYMVLQPTRIVPLYSDNCPYSLRQQGPHFPICNMYESPSLKEETDVAQVRRQGRSKRTRPKTPVIPEISAGAGAQGYESDNSNTIEEDLPLERRLKFCHHRRQSMPEAYLDEEGHDYRRFSGRMKKKTTFYGVSEANSGTSNNASVSERTRARNEGVNGPILLRRKSAVNSSPVSITQPMSSAAPPVVAMPTAPCFSGTKCPDVIKHDVEQSGSQTENVDNNGGKVTPTSQHQNKAESDVSTSAVNMVEFKKVFCINRLVWGKLHGYSWWPGYIVTYEKNKENEKVPADKQQKQQQQSDEGQQGSEVTGVWIKWYGENQLSSVPVDKVALIEEFEKYYNPTHMKGSYRKGVMAILKEAAKRCKMTFEADPNDKELCWVMSENSTHANPVSESPSTGASPAPCPSPGANNQSQGEDDCKEKKETEEDTEVPMKFNSNNNNSNNNNANNNNNSNRTHKARAGRKGRSKGEFFLTSHEREMLEWALKGFLPQGPLGGLMPTVKEQVEVKVVEDEEGDQPKKKLRVMILQEGGNKAHFDSVREGKVVLEEICLGCGNLEVVASHPLFHGGLCKTCKDNFMECAYMFDDDGSQMYCTICSAGDEVFMCDANNCSKVICQYCIEKLCGSEEVERVRASDTWLCYMCSPTHSQVGLLAKREDWDVCLRQLFMNNHEMEFEPPPILPPIPPELRKPLRVLGLFDGIGTGYLVLKELGLEVERYVSSEIDMDSINVSRMHHPEAIHVGDVCSITEKEVRAWGPFDLVFGGSPCNDLSIVNPARKGIYHGTGRLFFEFFRILSIVKPRPDEDRPFFWLFENVVSMQPTDKKVISRFLQCNPVAVDAKEVSAAHRARYFWGNLPGMNRPVVPLPSDRLTLQECLESNCFRMAQFKKLRTITTKMNSIKQNGGNTNPVHVKGFEEKEDILWCTEIERLFGFPEHYTDVGNLGRGGRQRLLGKAWSVPVIRHLLAPLKDYFMSSKIKDVVKEDHSAPSARERE